MPSSSSSAVATPPADASSEETLSNVAAEELRAGDTVEFGVSRMSSVRVQDMQQLGYFGGGVARVPGAEEVPEPEGELVVFEAFFAAGLRLSVYWGEGKLGANGEAEIPEVLAVKLLAVVNCEFGRYSEAANNVLLEEFLCSLWCYCGYSPRLDPFGKILNSDEGKLEVPLSRGQGPDNVQAPALERPCVGD
jgi:hypothetical protein